MGCWGTLGCAILMTVGAAEASGTTSIVNSIAVAINVADFFIMTVSSFGKLGCHCDTSFVVAFDRGNQILSLIAQAFTRKTRIIA